MVTPLSVDVITIALAVVDVVVAALAATISTLSTAVIASRERVVGAISTAGAPAGTAAGATTIVRAPPPSGRPSLHRN
jgi:hypothetical protein